MTRTRAQSRGSAAAACALETRTSRSTRPSASAPASACAPQATWPSPASSSPASSPSPACSSSSCKPPVSVTRCLRRSGSGSLRSAGPCRWCSSARVWPTLPWHATRRRGSSVRPRRGCLPRAAGVRRRALGDHHRSGPQAGCRTRTTWSPGAQAWTASSAPWACSAAPPLPGCASRSSGRCCASSMIHAWHLWRRACLAGTTASPPCRASTRARR
mmetsp:Transcript_11062/g.37659  ORF Transcript_11062/g.37659 Transcript_11062/m.37659 type:complete len:216 (-) Transcript_11062:162-809(-)